MRIASLLALALSLAACRSMDVRTHIPQNDALGRPKPIFDVEDEPGVWRWRVDTARLDGPIAAASDPHPGGLRVAVESAAALPGDADTHQAVESVSFEIPVGQGRWAGRPYASPACVDPIWVAAEVCVTWAIVLESRGTCAVLL